MSLEQEQPRTPFIPAWLDDLPLSPIAFRVLCRIYRRGMLWQSKQTLEREFKVSNRTLRAAFHELQEKGLISSEHRIGESSIYRSIDSGTRPPVLDSTAPSADEHCPPVLSGMPPQCYPAPTPSANEHHKGISNKVIPLRVSKEGKKQLPAVEIPFGSDEFVQAWGAWKQHRREIKKPLTPLAEKGQLNKLTQIGEQRAIAAINHSITSGWMGIYEGNLSHSAKPSGAGEPLNLGRRSARGDPRFAGTYEEIDIP